MMKISSKNIYFLVLKKTHLILLSSHLLEILYLYNIQSNIFFPKIILALPWTGAFVYVCTLVHSSVQSLSCVQLFVMPRAAACQASVSIINSWSLLKLMSIKSVMTSNHLILCRPLLPLPSIFPRIQVFSNESVLRIR